MLLNRAGIKPAPPDHQLDDHPTEPTRPEFMLVADSILKNIFLRKYNSVDQCVNPRGAVKEGVFDDNSGIFFSTSSRVAPILEVILGVMFQDFGMYELWIIDVCLHSISHGVMAWLLSSNSCHGNEHSSLFVILYILCKNVKDNKESQFFYIKDSKNLST